MRATRHAALCGVMILSALPAAALADDEGRDIGYAASGPVFDLPPGMRVARQDVHISPYSVRLSYVFKSTTQQTVHFSFALPEMPVDANPDIAALNENSKTAGLAADTQPPNYLNLSIHVNGQPLALTGHGRALLDGKDVTRQLLDAGVPLLSGPDDEPLWRHLSPEVQARLVARGLISSDTALWRYQASFAWDQPFAPGETRIEIRYSPMLHYWSDINLDSFSEIAPGVGAATKAYCIDDALRRAFFRKPTSYELYTVTHLADPSGGRRGPVDHYRLTIDKNAAANLVAFCPLAARKISPTTFEWTATNVTPDQEIGVLFFTAAPAPDTANANANANAQE